MNLIQIGANRGNDHVTKLIKESKKAFDKIVLIEPIKFVLEELKSCYQDVQNVIIETCIISTSKEKSKKIFYHRGSNYGTSTLNRTHLTDHGCPDDDIEFFEIENKTLTELLAKHHIDHLDYLFIDAEGFDIDILMSLDLSLVTVENIHLEIVHSDGAFKRGQKFKMLCEYLKSKDYDFTVNDVDLTAKRTRDNLK